MFFEGFCMFPKRKKLLNGDCDLSFIYFAFLINSMKNIG